MKIAALIPAFALIGCVSPGLAEVSPATPVADDFAPLSTPTMSFGSPLSAAQYFARFEPETDEGAPSLDLTVRTSDGESEYVMIVSSEGYADDSVRGEQWRIVVTRIEGGWKVTEAGRRFKCWRGGSPDEWQKALCP